MKKVAEIETHREHRRVSFQITAISTCHSTLAQAEEKQDELWSAEPQTDSLAALTDQICGQSCFITYFAVRNYA